MFKELKDSASKCKNLIVLAGILILGIIVVAILRLFGNIPNQVTYTGYADEEQFIYYLNNDDVLVQEFTSPHDFDYASVHFSDHEKSIAGKTFIKLEDAENNELLANYEYENQTIHHTEPVRIDFPNGGIKDHKYRITIWFEGFTDISLGIYAHDVEDSINPSCSGTHVAVEGEESVNLSDYAIAVGTHSDTKAYLVLVCWIVIVLCLFAIWGVFVLLNETWSDEKRFLAIVLPVGLLFLSFFSYNAVHDGMVHMAVSYHYSNCLMFNESENYPDEMSVYSDEIPIVKFYEDDENYHLESNLLNQWYDVVDNVGFRNSQVVLTTTDNFAKTSNSSIIEYLPAIIAITLSRIFHLSAVTGALLAKMFMFAFYVAGVYWAIKLSPAYKSLIAFIGLIPMNLYQATGMTYDTTVTVACLLLFAMYVKAHTCPLTNKDIIFVGVLCIILGLTKGGIYLLIPLAFIMIPKHESDTKNSKKKTIIAGLVGGFIGFVPVIIEVYGKYLISLKKDLPGYSERIVVDTVTGAELSRYTPKYMLKNPVETIKIMVNSLFNDWDKMVGQSIGNRMSWTNLETNWIIIGIIIVLLLLVVIKNKDEKTISLAFSEKVFIALMFAIEFVILNVIMLISETNIGDAVIKGVQGRYVLPWMAFLLLLLENKRFTVDNEGTRKMYFAYCLALAAYGLSFLCIYFNV